jgi:hypothetical protein
MSSKEIQRQTERKDALDVSGYVQDAAAKAAQGFEAFARARCAEFLNHDPIIRRFLESLFPWQRQNARGVLEVAFATGATFGVTTVATPAAEAVERATVALETANRVIACTVAKAEGRPLS